MALRWLDVPTLLNYGERFQFNRPIPFELPVQVSRMQIDESERGLAMSAAGFGDVGLSPLHAAMIGSSIANDGVMMSPCMIDEVRDAEGNTHLRMPTEGFCHDDLSGHGGVAPRHDGDGRH
ncbi:MAG: penicillin-binding transpeptidase domain-containing protein [Candidatus Manganitrophus sp.]|nr:penicillin-binding transpeptidase domain-containing protein [Candidatus Manganitrophus sp.]